MTDFTTITACGECCVGCSKKIYEEGGFRVVEIRKAGRAVLGEIV